ncbi:MAG: Undecaprenyl-phosphate mannosyltransferase, partial [Lacunisphaera sp.]|nr:Undecaprenyl-phosphate mannosyltransferase [Lacunisphaera sp.]
MAGTVRAPLIFAAMPSVPLSLYSIIIPARDEQDSLPSTLADIYATFQREGVPHEIVVVDDGSRDKTWAVLMELRQKIPTLAPVQNPGQNGFGRAVLYGLSQMKGDACALMMADASDSPDDAVRYWRLLGEGWDCVFGSRFVKGGKVVDYPRVKLFVNRLANFLVRLGFNIPLNDT